MGSSERCSESPESAADRAVRRTVISVRGGVGARSDDTGADRPRTPPPTKVRGEYCLTPHCGLRQAAEGVLPCPRMTILPWPRALPEAMLRGSTSTPRSYGRQMLRLIRALGFLAP